MRTCNLNLITGMSCPGVFIVYLYRTCISICIAFIYMIHWILFDHVLFLNVLKSPLLGYV